MDGILSPFSPFKYNFRRSSDGIFNKHPASLAAAPVSVSVNVVSASSSVTSAGRANGPPASSMIVASQVVIMAKKKVATATTPAPAPVAVPVPPPVPVPVETEVEVEGMRSYMYSRALGDLLAKYDAEDHFEEISKVINNSKFRKHVSQWSVVDTADFIMSLQFLGEERSIIAEVICREWIDGPVFLHFDSNSWELFGLSKVSFILISCIRDAWTSGCFIPDTFCEKGQDPCVVLGIKTDLSNCSSKAEVAAIIGADDLAIKTGRGLVYGQLVVIGYKQFRTVDGVWEPVGANNCKFMLKRRRVANGKTLKPLASSKIPSTRGQVQASRGGVAVGGGSGGSSGGGGGDKFLGAGDSNAVDSFLYSYDPSMDVYQLGRMDFTQANDFLIHGPIHSNKNGGMDEEDKLFLGEGALVVYNNKTKNFDALTTFGTQLWCPKTLRWYEVSLRGYLFSSRADFLQGNSIGSLSSNELLSGSIIDLCGVKIMFQSFEDIRNQKIYSPQVYMERLNALKPQCPVLLHSIQFSYMDQRERAKRHMKRLINNIGSGYMPVNDIKVPTTDYHDIQENHRSYVFPCCGHTYSYHKSLEGKSCPLCRAVGPYVPIAFEFEPAICSNKPTNVFNPCGHVTSLAVAKYWSGLKMFYHENHDNRSSKVTCSICPYCSTALSDTKPFSRLILQTESGDNWESDDFLECKNGNMSSAPPGMVGNGNADELSFWKSLYNQSQSIRFPKFLKR